MVVTFSHSLLTVGARFHTVSFSIFFSRAAEARNRIRIMRLRYQANKAQEISHLISCQPSALNAVRLQALLPTKTEPQDKDDTLERLAVSILTSSILYHTQSHHSTLSPIPVSVPDNSCIDLSAVVRELPLLKLATVLIKALV